MTHEQKINYMRIAAGVAGFGFRNEQLDLLVSLYELVKENEGRTNLYSISDIEVEVKKRADTKKKSELLDKFSTKTDE